MFIWNRNQILKKFEKKNILLQQNIWQHVQCFKIVIINTISMNL